MGDTLRPSAAAPPDTPPLECPPMQQQWRRTARQDAPARPLPELWALLGLLFLAAATPPVLCGYEYQGLVGSILVQPLAAALFILWEGVARVWHWRRNGSLARRPSAGRRVRLWAVFLGWVCGSSAGVVLPNMQNAEAKAMGDRICAALQTFHQEHGRYPKQLASIVPLLPDGQLRDPIRGITWSEPWEYHTYEHGGQLRYSLAFYPRDILFWGVWTRGPGEGWRYYD